MPMSFKPLSRRGFLAQSAGVLAAGSLAQAIPITPADEIKTDEFRFALLSDIHIAAQKDLIAKETIHMWSNLQTVIGQVLALNPRPANCIINGDLAFHRGEMDDYDTCMEAIGQIRKAGIAVHIGMGNHDNRVKFYKAVPEEDKKKKLVANRQVWVFDSPRATIFMLDSLLEVEKRPGMIGQAQLNWFNKELTARKDKPAIVFVHHNPDEKTENVEGLVDTRPFLKILDTHKHVKAYIHGHTHEWQYTERDGLHILNLPTTAWVKKMGQPNGWVDCLLREDGMNIELLCLDEKHANHKQKMDLKWRNA